MAGFMKNAMQYLGMADVAEDDEPMDIQDEDPGFDDDHSVTPVSQAAPSSPTSAPSRESNPFQGRVSRITTIHPKSYEDAQLVGRAIRDGVPVVLNLTGVSEAVAYRIVDFFRGRRLRRARIHRACHSARVPAQPDPGEHQGGGAAGAVLGARPVRRLICRRSVRIGGCRRFVFMTAAAVMPS